MEVDVTVICSIQCCTTTFTTSQREGWLLVIDYFCLVPLVGQQTANPGGLFWSSSDLSTELAYKDKELNRLTKKGNYRKKSNNPAYFKEYIHQIINFYIAWWARQWRKFWSIKLRQLNSVNNVRHWLLASVWSSLLKPANLCNGSRQNDNLIYLLEGIRRRRSIELSLGWELLRYGPGTEGLAGESLLKGHYID